MKVYYKIVLLVLIMTLVFSVSVQGEDENDYSIVPTATTDTVKKWDFGDEEFNDLPSKLEGDAEFGDLVLHKGIAFKSGEKEINNKRYSRYVEVKFSEYISLSLDGPSNVYFIGQSNSIGDERDLKITGDDKSQISYVTTNEPKGYCYKYRGTGETIDISAIGGTIRVYAIMVEAYDDKKFDYLNNYPTRLWDLSQISKNETVTDTIDINGLKVFKGVNLLINEHNNQYGFRYYNAIDLEFEGTDEKCSIALDVQKDTDIYITARSTSTYIRQLRITNKYGCDIDTENNIQRFDVTDDADTFKLSYKGESDTLYMYSESGAIRIYQVAAIKQTNKEAKGINCNFSECADIAMGENLNGKTISGLSFVNGTAITSTDTAYSKAIKLNGNRFALADKISFDISAPSTKKIKVVAKKLIYNPKLVVADKYGYVVGSADLSDTLQEYEFEYIGCCETLYVFFTSGSGAIYGISTCENAEPVVYETRFSKGQKYRYSFTVENAPTVSGYKFAIEYDPTKLKVVHIGKDNNIDGGLTDKSIKNVVNGSGKITFDIADSTDESWSGIATSVIFEAIADGTSTIKFSTGGI